MPREKPGALKKSSPWTADLPLPVVRLIGVVGDPWGVGRHRARRDAHGPVLVGAASVGLALLFIGATVFHLGQGEARRASSACTYSWPPSPSLSPGPGSDRGSSTESGSTGQWAVHRGFHPLKVDSSAFQLADTSALSNHSLTKVL